MSGRMLALAKEGAMLRGRRLLPQAGLLAIAFAAVWGANGLRADPGEGREAIEVVDGSLTCNGTCGDPKCTKDPPELCCGKCEKED